MLDLAAIDKAEVNTDPYPYLIADNVLPIPAQEKLREDFPDFDKPGFFPLSMAKQKGAFAELIADLQKKEYSAMIGDKLGLELRDKPQMITIRKWSELKAGRIHNDSESKICTSLIYLNDNWDKGDGGRLRVLRNEKSFDSTAAEIPPVYGTLFAFKRTNNSWHGHKPFEGERRVVQITWLRSQADLDRKEKRGNFSYLIKKIFSGSGNY